ncbi:MAG: sigma 54-interacting transcriptional regulator [Candidatus Cloacimonetes bacterium]|nr:sigma 54-interacting transcriptional regulator [Candidatus Cloacimonadota bacterium]
MKNTDISIEKLEKQLQKAKEKFNEEKIIRILDELLIKYKESNDLSKMQKIALELIQIYETKGKKEKLTSVLLELGYAYTKSGDFENSILSLEKLIAMIQESDDPIKKVRAYTNIGINYENLGDYDKGVANYLLSVQKYEEQIKSLKESEKNKWMMIYGDTLQNLGVTYGKLDQNEKSRNYFLKALKITEESNDYLGTGQALSNLGVSYTYEDPGKSLEYFKQSLIIVKKLNSPEDIAININNIGGAYKTLEQYDEALQYYFEALNFAEENKLVNYMPHFLIFIGNVYQIKGEYEKAIDYIKRSLEFSLKHKNAELIKSSYQVLSEINEKQENYKSALEFHKKYSKQKDRILNKEMIDKISGLQEKYEKSSQRIVDLKRHCSLVSKVLKKSIKTDFIGNSINIKKVLETAMTAAVNPDVNVLILGESGTGKEIIANIIHYGGSRKDNMIVAVNPCSIPETLMESEFFGYMKGSFTGAVSDKIGFLELADKGTLFLDEIADTPISLQAKLLRVLENKQIRKLGAKNEKQVNFRVIAATNKYIDELVEKSRFRLDLLHRINTITIKIPPLRERQADIEPLLHHFIREFSETLKKPVPKLNVEVVQKLKKYHFPGNVRELRNMVEKAIIMLKSETLEPEHFETGDTPCSDDCAIYKPKLTNLSEIEKETIEFVLNKTNNNHTHSAKLLGISYTTLLRKLKKM